jgi:hypothetical protein
VHSARGETLCVRTFRRADWQVETVTRTILSANATTFFVHADLNAYENGLRVYAKSWDHEVPRDHL